MGKLTAAGLLGALILTSCQKTPEQAPKSGSAPKSPLEAGTCAERASSLARWLTQVSHLRVWLPAVSSRSLVVHEGATPARQGLVVSVSQKQIALSDRRVYRERAVWQQEDHPKMPFPKTPFEALRGVLESPSGGSPPPVYLLIEQQTPWLSVLAAAEATRAAGYPQLSLVFAKQNPSPPPAPPAPPPSSIDQELKERPIDGDEQFYGLLARITQRCQQAGTAIRRLNNSESEEQAKETIRATSAALEACNCDVEIPSLQALLWQVKLPPETLYAYSVIELAYAAPEAEAVSIEASEDDRWEAVAPKVLEKVKANDPRGYRFTTPLPPPPPPPPPG